MAKRKRYVGNLERLATAFRYRVMLNGKMHRYTVETTDETQAIEFAIGKYAELTKTVSRAARRGSVDFLRFSQLATRFESDRLPMLTGGQKSYRHVLALAREYFGGQGDSVVTEISSGHIADFLAWRRVQFRGPAGKNRTRPIDPKTIRKTRAILSSVFTYAEEIKAVEYNPVTKVKAPKSDERAPVILSADQYEALLAACTHPMVRLYVLALGETGGRCESEILWLRWEDVNLEASRLEIVTGRDGHRTKGGKSRRVPLTPRLRDAFRNHFAAYRFSGSPWVFHHVRQNGHAKRGERLRSLRRAVESAVKRAGLPADFRQHDLRHRRVTKWLAEGASPVHVQRAVGHASITTTMKYTHLADQHVDALLEHEATRGKSVARTAAKA